MKVSIEALDVTCGYYNETVLEDVTLHLSSGDFIGIIGPNGAGKTTLLRLLCKNLKPRSGKVLLNQENLLSYSARQIAQEVGVVPQEIDAAFSFTVEETVLMGRNPHQGFSWGYSRHDLCIAKEAMEHTETISLSNRVLADLSGGERQRVIIAQVLAQEPQILLLDEPTTHLDINHQLEILDLIRKLNMENQLAVLAIFHDLNLAAQYCKQLLLLKKGKVIAFGKPSEILTPPLIKEVFDVDVAIDVHPLTQRLFLTPLQGASARLAHGTRASFNIHLICGGNTGGLLMSQLLKHGYSVTCGILNIMDTDQKTAEFFGIPHVSEAPFSPISDSAYEKGLKQISGSNVVIVTNLPFGQANLRNLDLAHHARKKGITTIILNSPAIEMRDYTNGRAQIKLMKLVEDGAILIDQPEKVFEILSHIEKRRLHA